ncbi:MAG: hypothetical protein ACON35_03385 [Candidatus Marinamargulisbacteria bacterium]
MKKMIFLMVLVASTSLMAENLITLSGSAVTGFSGIDQSEGAKAAQLQFESAANINIGIEHSDEINAEINIGAGSDNNTLGFQSGITYLGFALNYAPKQFAHTSFTAGSITVPFGQFSGNQTDNARFSSSFILNDIGYSLLTKNDSLSDFGGNGVQSTTQTPYATIDAMVFNGTGGHDTNPDQGFGVALRLTNASLVKNTTFGVSFVNSNDSGNQNAINANTTGFIGDVKTQLYGLDLGGYYGVITLDDSNASTKDDVAIAMVYVGKKLNQYDIAVRYSVLQPEDHNGDGSGYSSAFNAGYGLSDISVADVDLARIQLSGIYNLSNSVKLVNEVVLDTYGKNFEDFNNTAVLSYASVNF